MEEKTRIKNLYKLFKEHKEGRWIMETPNVESLYALIKAYSYSTLGVSIIHRPSLCSLNNLYKFLMRVFSSMLIYLSNSFTYRVRWN